MVNERNIMAKVLGDLSKIQQPGKAKRTSVPPVIVAILGLNHRDEVFELVKTASVPEDVQNFLNIQI